MAKSNKIPKLPVQQLVILALCRLADPISFSSVFPYLPEMIESFGVPENEVGRWAGITAAVFSLSQAATGIAWGRASDRFGRKPVILAGMICVMSTGLLFGFSRNLPMAIVARSLAGASNGNVGILRTTVAELVPQKELQPRAQTNINLLTYTLLALHSVAYDQLLPIFMHHPTQIDRSSNPNVHLPFKFSGGFGIDSDRIGLLFTLYGVSGTIIQFLIFPPIARRYGVLNSLKVVTILFPLAYIATPFTALLSNPRTQQIAMFLIMLIKCFAAIFAFPCTIILLTNSAVSLRILGTLNGVATSVSAIGRATGPAIGGAMFEVGAVHGWAILPWWVLAGFAVLGAIPVWWLVEMDGFGGSGDDGCDEDEAETPEVPHAEEEGTQQPVGMGSPKVKPREVPEVDESAKGDEGLLSTSNLLDQMGKSSGGPVAMPLRRGHRVTQDHCP
ncbi:MAG: hypothetical protein Q9196_002206 [Gyalolechia fulgens]